MSDSFSSVWSHSVHFEEVTSATLPLSIKLYRLAFCQKQSVQTCGPLVYNFYAFKVLLYLCIH